MDSKNENTTVFNIKRKLRRHTDYVKNTCLYDQTIHLLKPVSFTHIRCLALGSPTEEFQALYQLALLDLLIKEFSIKTENISLYDPAFTDNDIQLFTELGFEVKSSCQWDNKTTLYFMPHAPRSMTEVLINQERLLFILGNDLSVTIGTLSRAKFLETYPTLATITHICEKNVEKLQKLEKLEKLECVETLEKLDMKPKDDFKVVKNGRRRRRPNKLVYTEPELSYDLNAIFFEDVKIVRINSPDTAIWKDSFSDLALNILVCRKADPPSDCSEVQTKTIANKKST